MVTATASGVSIVALATSMQPTSTSLPASSPSSDNGTFEFAHSRET